MFLPEEPEESLETLNKDLYSRRDYFSGRAEKQGRFKPHDIEVPKNWGGESVKSQNRPFQNPADRLSFLRKLFIVSLVFFLVSAGVALYVIMGGGNVVSSNNVAIAVTGPVSVSGGEVIPLEISVSNQNSADLVSADLVINYPDGTTQPLDQGQPLKVYRQSLGAISKGGITTQKVQAVLFGQAGETKAIQISVEYRISGSNAIFSKKKEYDVAISSSPITLTIGGVSEINANQDVELTIDAVSNSGSVVQNLAVSAEYPFGFTFENSDPVPSWSDSFWQLGDLKPGVKRTIKVRGKIAGQDNDSRTFKFSVGTEDPRNENSIGISFLTATKAVTVKKPSVGASLALNGDTSDTYIAKPGNIIRADLTLSNNAGVKITDVKVSVKLSGNIFDPGAVSAGDGFFRSAEKTLLWDQTLRQALAVFNPDNTITLSFSLGTLVQSPTNPIENPEMDLAVTVTSLSPDATGVSEQVTSTLSRAVRLASNLGLSARALYYSGPFTNTGPIPPKADSDTSYTVVWALTNGSNDLSNVKVSATLPTYMKWLGVLSPQNEGLTYNPIGGQIVWNVGDLPARTGFANSPRQVNFQVSLNPSTSQIRTTPTLMTDMTAAGDDAFAGSSVQISAPSLTTDLTTDIGFKPGQGVVTK